jgi:hypothetical protein
MHDGNFSSVVYFTTLQYHRLYGGITGKHLQGSSRNIIKELYWNVSGWREENLNQKSQYHSTDLNQAPSKYKFKTILLSHPAWYNKNVTELNTGS